MALLPAVRADTNFLMEMARMMLVESCAFLPPCSTCLCASGPWRTRACIWQGRASMRACD